MSFEDLKVAELKDAAAEFAVDLTGVSGKGAIIAALVENGVEFNDYEALVGRREAGVATAESLFTEKPVDKPTVPKPEYSSEQPVVVKMERANPAYEAAGFLFTREHPYQPMTVEEAQNLFDLEPVGFRLATPREVQEYYS